MDKPHPDPLDHDTTRLNTTEADKHQSLQPGSALGQYRIIRLLGRGGMGEVYLAEHVQMHKHYALKVLPEELSSDPQFISRFRVEARVMADLDHPNIVRVHHMGEDDGFHYLTMDYVEGPDGEPRTLEQELEDQGRLPEQRVREIARQICDALSYAHTFKSGAVIHRDIKPSNILLDEDGHVKVSDFGLAKVLGAEYLQSVIDKSVKLSMAGAVSMGDKDTGKKTSSVRSILGTYEYMSPEQKAGGEVDVRTDIYSFGLMLYRMLTGEKPEGAYKPPSRYGARSGWDGIVEKCLQRNLFERYGSVSELRAAIARASLRRGRGTRIALAAVAVAAALCAAWWVWRGQAPSAKRPVLDDAQPAKEQMRDADAGRRAEEARLADLAEKQAQDEARNAKVDAELAREEAQRLNLDQGPGWAEVEKNWRLGSESYANAQWQAAVKELRAAENGARTIKSEHETAELKQKQIEEYEGAKAAWHQARSGADIKTLDSFGGTDWTEVKRLVKLGTESASDPVVGAEHYRDALEKLPGVIAAAQSARQAAEEKDRLAQLKAAYDLALTDAQRFEKAGKWKEAADAAGNAMSSGWADTTVAVALLETIKKKLGSEPGKDFPLDLGGNVRMEFVWVEALKGWVGKYEVTNEEYRRFKKDHDSKEYEGYSLNGERQPVVYVSYNDAVALAAWVNKTFGVQLPAGYTVRLPDGKEWLTFAQCGDGREYPWGKDWPPKYGNYDDETEFDKYRIEGYNDGYKVTCPVEKSGSNDWGLYGVGGNVWEWTSELYERGSDRRVLRGASWYVSFQDYLRCSCRYAPSDRDDLIGFRLVVLR